MPRPILLPSEVPDEEIRIYWDHTDEGDDLHVWALRSMRRLALGFFADKRTEYKGDFGQAYKARQDGLLVDEPSFIETLDAMGYDPKSIVFSILKKGAARPAPETDNEAHIASVLSDLDRLKTLLDEGANAKSAVIFDETEIEGIWETIASIEDRLGQVALNVATTK